MSERFTWTCAPRHVSPLPAAEERVTNMRSDSKAWRGAGRTEVVSRRMRWVKMTVKNGEEALMVSVKEAATLASETSPSRMVDDRMIATSSMFRRNAA